MKSHQNRTAKFKHFSKTFLFVFVLLIAANSAFCQYPDTLITLTKNSDKYFLKRIPAGFVQDLLVLKPITMQMFCPGILLRSPMLQRQMLQKNFLPVLQ